LSWEGVVRSAVAYTEVWFTSLDEDDMDWYVRSGEPRDKAGAYAIQGLASRFVTRIDGSYSNVVGLPVAIVLQLLAQAGLSAIASAAPAPYPEE
jgi:septum formation protein